ncbi:Gfo/Idh/MocA family protein [Verrucomicrobiota bacterium]
MKKKLSRRRFIYGTVAGGAVLSGVFPLRWAYSSPNEKINVACVGCGGRGAQNANNVKNVQGVNISAFCDVDDDSAAELYSSNPDIPKFKDYRKMFEKMSNDIDAVVVTTPDHAHFPIGMAAIQLGKHVYIEKPLTHSIKQAREIMKAAREKKVATQMGNQGHSAHATYLVKEWIQAGLIGQVKEVLSWTNRPSRWPQGMQKLPAGQPVPAHLDWKLWQAGVTDYKYNRAYLPFKWRGWYAFGCGAMGDMGCHVLDAPFYALDLGAARTVRVHADVAGESSVAFPKGSTVTMEISARGKFAPVTLTWFDGKGKDRRRPEHLDQSRSPGHSASVIVGESSSIMTGSHAKSTRIIPEVKMREAAPDLPPQTLPRPEKGDHYQSWIEACRGGSPASSNFDYAAPLTELCLLGVIAQRLPGKKLEWDKEKGFLNNEEANLLVNNTVPEAG